MESFIFDSEKIFYLLSLFFYLELLKQFPFDLETFTLKLANFSKSKTYQKSISLTKIFFPTQKSIFEIRKNFVNHKGNICKLKNFYKLRIKIHFVKQNFQIKDHLF